MYELTIRNIRVAIDFQQIFNTKGRCSAGQPSCSRQQQLQTSTIVRPDPLAKL